MEYPEGLSAEAVSEVFAGAADLVVRPLRLDTVQATAFFILESGQSVTAVAERTGFNNQSYFSKAFKRETGKNPSDYKRL